MEERNPDYEPQKKSGGKAGLIVAIVILSVVILLLIALVVLLGTYRAGGFGRYDSRKDPFETVEEHVAHWAEGIGLTVDEVLGEGFTNLSYRYSNADSYKIGHAEIKAGDINKLLVDWVSGEVEIRAYDGDTISISETPETEENYRLRWLQEGSKLTIRYCDSKPKGKVPQKTLTVLVPAELADKLQVVEISTLSADASVTGLEAGRLDFDSTSGEGRMDGAYSMLDVTTTSGGVEFTGSARDVEIETVSGGMTLYLSDTPEELSFESVSGDLKLILPERRSFEAELDTASGSLHSDALVADREGEWFYEGTVKGAPAELEFETVSGDVWIEIAAK